MQRPIIFLTALLSLLAAAAVPALAALPPKIDIEGALGDVLIRERWQPLLVTLTNPDDGDAVQGEVQVVVEDANMAGRRLATATRAISLARGPGRAQTVVYVRIPEGVNTDLTVYVTSNGETVTRRRWERVVTLPEQFTLLVVSDAPDALAYLRGKSLGVVPRGGVLRRFQEMAPPPRRGRNFGDLRTEDKVVPSVPVLLPDKALGYDGVAIIYLGDIAPDTLSDAQVAALRGWVTGGGLLVANSPRLPGDERFRDWLPARWGPAQPLSVDLLAARYRTSWDKSGATGILYNPLTPLPGARPLLPNGPQALAVYRREGRGTVVALGFDAASPGFAAWPGNERLWRDVAARGITTRGVARALDEDEVRWTRSSFATAVMRAPGLRAPSFGYIGLFLLAYLMLLVPVNYAVLKRLDRREWTWLTVPILVTLFSLGAYAFGYAIKGGQMRLNTATIIEMGPTSGQGEVTASAGLFSPRRTSYDVSLADAQALLFDPEMWNRGQNNYAPLIVGQDGGAHARDADVSMWAMRVFGARTTANFGKGLQVRLRAERGDIVGTVENQTGHRLEEVRVFVGGQPQAGVTLPPGERIQVRVPGGVRLLGAFRNPFPDQWNNWNWGNVSGNVTEESRTRAAIQSRVQSVLFMGINNGINQQRIRELDGGPPAVLVAAWNYDLLLPLRVNGRTVGAGDHVNLFLVHAPVEGNIPMQIRPLRRPARFNLRQPRRR